MNITINNKAYPVKFGYAALSEFCKAKGWGLAQLENLGENLSLDDIYTLCLCGLKHGARKSGTELDITEWTVLADWHDEHPEFIEEVMSILTDSFPAAEAKKKQPRKV